MSGASGPLRTWKQLSNKDWALSSAKIKRSTDANNPSFCKSLAQTVPVVIKLSAPGAKEKGPAQCKPRLSAMFSGDSNQPSPAGSVGAVTPVVSKETPGNANKVTSPIPLATKPFPFALLPGPDGLSIIKSLPFLHLERK